MSKVSSHGSSVALALALFTHFLASKALFFFLLGADRACVSTKGVNMDDSRFLFFVLEE